MIRTARYSVVLSALILIAGLKPSAAWEASTTHAGLVESSALLTKLHERIERDLGIPGGLFARLVVPPADAPAMSKLLSKFNPTHGYVPDTRGRSLALGWLAAGAALADSPAKFAGNHFLDPTKGTGLDDRTLSKLTLRAKHKLAAKRAGETLISGGMPAHEWIVAKDNPLGVAGFLHQYEKAVTARTPGERERHLAGALVAAGAIVHVLQDMASPSHVRVDLAAHLAPIGASSGDVGSRFERIAALAFGRLGIPGSARPVRKDRLESFFIAEDETGLAQIVHDRFFSQHTMPKTRRLPVSPTPGDIAAEVRRAIGRDPLTIEAAGAGYRVSDERGMCLAIFAARARDIHFYSDDDCALSQLEVLMPLAVAYGAGALDFLFRGQLTLEQGKKGLEVGYKGKLGKGKLLLLWDDELGVRTVFHEVAVSGKLPGSLPAAPAGHRRVSAIFVGSDDRGEPLIATGSLAAQAGK